jgi:hypothetical protein
MAWQSGGLKDIEVLLEVFVLPDFNAVVIPLRINDPIVIDKEEVESLFVERGAVAIQFSKPPYPKDVLRDIEALCKVHRESLEVRFYGHYSTDFDCSVLLEVPSAMNVSVDCMQKARNIEIFSEMKSLKKLSLGVDEMNFPEILALPSLQALEELRIGETKAHPVRLGPLAQYQHLRNLSIAGQSKGIEKLGLSSSIEELYLNQIKKNVALDFITKMSGLRSLRLLLGGRPNIYEVKHQTLTKLEIVRVMGFETISLDSFPLLEELKIEDQIRLKSINFSAAGPNLRQVWLLNCKSLDSLGGFAELSKLEHIRISRTALDFDQLISVGIPKSLHVFAFYDRSNTKTKSIRSRLDKMGYLEYTRNGKTA